ncbi:MAG TPA: AAA family ATPase, partial [Acidimicrobiales bacterium]
MRHHGSPRGFVGRSDQLKRFETALAQAATGVPTVFVVTGEAGVGKSRLVEQWLAAADAADAVAMVGHCVQLEHASFPYAPVVEAVRSLVRQRGAAEVRRLLGRGCEAFAELVPELDTGPLGASTPGAWGQGQLFEAMLGLLHRLGTESAGRGVVAVIEDLHWADGATLELLNYVVRNVTGSPVVMVLTARDELALGHPLRLWTAELLRVEAVERVSLAGFGRADTADLLTLRAGEPQPAALVEDIYRRSDGNPFLIEELFEVTRRGGAPIMPTLRDTVMGRVGTLTPSARHLLDVVAVGGGRVPSALLETVVDMTPAAWRVALTETTSAPVLVADGDTYGFRHAAFAESVYDAMLVSERTRLHARYAAAIETRPELAGAGSEAQMAAHWLAAGVAERALPAAVGAAEAAERLHAPADALAQWDAALGLLRAGPNLAAQSGLDEVELVASAAEAANRAGRVDRAVDLVRDALVGVDRHAEP